MSKVCDLCGKGYQKGNLVSHSHRRTIRRTEPNLRSVRLMVDGKMKKMRLCTSCLKSTRLEKA